MRQPTAKVQANSVAKNARRSCTRCGREAHPREKCPAINAECHRCKRKGHYGAMCRSKTIASSVHTCTTTIPQDEDIAFLDNLSPSNQESVCSATIQVATTHSSLATMGIPTWKPLIKSSMDHPDSPSRW